MRAAWLAQAQAHPNTTLGLAGATLAILWLLVTSGYNALHADGEAYLRYGMLGDLGDLGVGLPLTTAIAIQDIPEGGLAVAMALRTAGLAPLRAALVAAAPA